MSVPGTPPRRPAKRDPSLLNIALRPRDPAIERALQLSTFETNYSAEDFIGTLSEKVVSESKANPGPFDAKPFIQTFSPALDSLLALRAQVADRTKRMESDVRRAEREYGKRLRELDGGFEAIGSSFSNLESKITDVGRTAVRIGEQLDSLHQTRSTAQSTSLLLSYYLSLVHQTSTTPDPNNPSANATPLEALFATRTSRDGRARLAVILRRLMAVAKDVAENASSALIEAETAATPKMDDSGTLGEIDKGSVKMVLKRKKEKEKAERVRDEIERYCEKFEKELLRLFDRSYRKGDPRMMAHCAKTLQDFNGGASCVQIYVNQHDFFISKDRMLEDAEKEAADGENGQAPRVDIWKTIGDPDAPPPTTEPGMEALFKEIRVTVSQEVQIVKAVFPNPSSVMEVFLRRVFAQVIQQQLETLVSRASAISTLAMLRILHLTHSLCSALVEDLKSYDLQLSAPMASTTKGSAPSAGPLAGMLDQAMEEMFVPWLEGTRYLETESKNLVELYAGLLSRFTRYHETVLKAKPNSLLDRVVGQISSNSNGPSSSTAHTAAAAISKYANLFAASASSAVKSASSAASPAVQTKPHIPPHLAVPRSGADTPNRPGTPQGGRPGLQRSDSMRGEMLHKAIEDKVFAVDGVLTVAMAERMLKWHAEAVGRVVELSGTGDIAKNAHALSKVLGEGMGRSFIETALDSALAKMENAESKLEPDLSVLAVLKPADLICHLWQRYGSTALLPLASSNIAIRREMATYNTHNVVRMEGKINAVIQKALDGIVNWLGHLLTKQKKNDYRPKDDMLSFARTTTEPCQLCCEFLEDVHNAAKEALSGKNAEAFLTEVGVAFHSLLLDHYKKFPVNPTGGLMLTKDLASYQEAAATFGIPAVNDRFDMLRQLGNSFIVQPNVLKSYMTESHLGRIDARLLRPYLAQRSDYSQFSRSLNLDDGAGGPLPEVEHSTLSVTRSKGSRLSTMSGVAGVGMGKLKEMLKELDSGGLNEPTRVRQTGTGKGVVRTSRNIPAGYMPPPVYFGIH
ncbi:exocyst complex component Sec10-domain-containing protein [Naematelia encephala]|uniref:Exocyst complex component Sec10-domain-containing protein n=1 Tax=Naematelia encephala TaxID=71784 RepID=A0A1Y2AYT5_9TREE|nr:exocyst complex component Sec10-domain-containing protein [Naematelia encephala]